MDEEKKKQIEEQLRIIRGRSALGDWNMRRQRLDEVISMFEAWMDQGYYGDPDDQETHRRLYNIPGIAPAIENLTEALRVVDAEIQALAEFAPRKNGKRKT